MKVTICIGSSCHLKGSRQVVEALQNHVKEANLQDKVELGGAFCIGNCQNGVSVTVDGVVHSVNPDNVGSFFENEIKSKV
ncbi:MAG: (2Fe-2S) ferredoxin domain-containing protein [Ruminococcus sp.]|nr:(2Fe-2S) ferredoxin domain-containing protein [Ruminococcus sp.]